MDQLTDETPPSSEPTSWADISPGDMLFLDSVNIHPDNQTLLVLNLDDDKDGTPSIKVLNRAGRAFTLIATSATFDAFVIAYEVRQMPYSGPVLLSDEQCSKSLYAKLIPSAAER